MSSTTLILGASPKPDRYSNMAQRALSEAGYKVIPYNPRGGEFDGVEVVSDLATIEQPVDTVTVYVRAAIFQTLLDGVVELKPRRIIFNPGTEDEGLEKQLRAEGIEVMEACTLVMLKTGQY